MQSSRLTPTQLAEARRAWTDWVREHLRPAVEQVPAAMEAAVDALQRGGSRTAAGWAARQRLGLLTRADLQQVQQELLRVRAARQELESLAPWELEAAPANRLKELFDARARVLQSLWDGGFARPGTPVPVGTPAGLAAGPPASPTAAKGPSLREFLAERSILLVSYTGAFLLVVATVLFEVYGLKGQGELRFAGVVALDLVFAAAGWACWRVPYLRVVGRTYVALAALMLPLVFAAAYVFLALHDRGLSVDAALAIAGPSCCLLYGLLAVRLRSQGYGVLAMLALPAGWYGALQVLGLHAWLGPGLAPLAAVYAWLAYGSDRFGALGRTFAGTAELFLHAAALVAAGTTAVQFDPDLGRAAWWRPAVGLALIAAAYAGSCVTVQARRLAVPGLAAAALAWLSLMLATAPATWVPPAVAALTLPYALLAGTPRQPARAAGFRFGAEVVLHLLAVLAIGLALDRTLGSRMAETLAVVTVAYALYCWLSGRLWMTWTVAVGVTATVAAAQDRLHWGPTAGLVELVLLAAAYAAAAHLLRSRVRHLFRAGAVLQAAFCVFATTAPDSWQAVALLAGAALMLAIALDVASPWWLLASSALLAAAWLPLAKTLLPHPAHSDLGTLITIFSPLPVLLAAVALVTGRAVSVRWALPLYLAAGFGGVVVAAWALSWQDYRLLGSILLAYAGATYVAAAVERAGVAVPVALLSATAGSIALLFARGAPDYAYPLALAAAAWTAYAGGLLWERLGARGARWIEVHRYSGLAGAGLTALFGFADRGLWTATGVLALTALAVTLALALMLLLDGRLERIPLLEYAAAAAASLGGVWIARYLGQTNPQAYVALPGLALVAIGVAMPYDGRLRNPKPFAWGAAALGLAVLLGTTAVQAFSEAKTVLYTPLLVIEGVSALLLGIGFRSRVLALGGSAGVAVGALWSLFVFEVPLWADFGLIAILLLAAGAVLALLKDRLGATRAELAQTWRDWN